MAQWIADTLQKFRSYCASASEDDEIILPEEAEWDWAEEYGTNDYFLYVKCNIKGNNTIIRNFHGAIIVSKYGNTTPKITALHFLDAFYGGTSVDVGGITIRMFIYNGTFSLCKLSVQMPINCGIFSRGATFSRCSLNVDFMKQGSVRILQTRYPATLAAKAEFCRIKINAQNATGWIFDPEHGDIVDGYRYYCCELIVDAPQADGLGMRKSMFDSCTVRGQMPNVEEIGSGFGISTVICKEGMPKLNISSLYDYQKKWFVTDSQMRDPEYLHGIGFWIGSEFTY